MNDLIAAVRKTAEANYNKGGWDVIVECWTDEEIQEVIEEDGLKTEEEVIEVFSNLASIWAERQNDAINSVW